MTFDYLWHAPRQRILMNLYCLYHLGIWPMPLCENLCSWAHHLCPIKSNNMAQVNKTTNSFAYYWSASNWIWLKLKWSSMYDISNGRIQLSYQNIVFFNNINVLWEGMGSALENASQKLYKDITLALNFVMWAANFNWRNQNPAIKKEQTIHNSRDEEIKNQL